jgi:hypothetical protein
MKTAELRIGNWIIEPNNEDKNPFQIFSIYDEPKNEKLNGLPINYFQPIPLTEEWLNKFDFITTYGTWKFRGIEYYSIESNGSLYFDDQYTATDIKYVHQLQNLYFALTGEELTIKI